jgi:glutathione S-transferase
LAEKQEQAFTVSLCGKQLSQNGGARLAVARLLKQTLGRKQLSPIGGEGLAVVRLLKQTLGMILIGQYDSPFVRRVGIALTLYDLAFEHRPWSAFSDAFRIRPFNPLIRVPTLILDDGEVLVESHTMIDYLDSLMPDERVLLPRTQPERRRAMKVMALATGLGDKAVNLFYEQRMHSNASASYVERLTAQIDGTLDVLEATIGGANTPYVLGDTIGHADIALGCMWHFMEAAHPGLVSEADFPALAAMSARLEALEVFQAINQPFIAPA